MIWKAVICFNILPLACNQRLLNKQLTPTHSHEPTMVPAKPPARGQQIQRSHINYDEIYDVFQQFVQEQLHDNQHPGRTAAMQAAVEDCLCS